MTLSLTDWLTNSLTDFHFCHAKNNSRNLWSLRHLIRVMRRHDFMTLSTLSTFCILIILRQILTIWRTVWETWHLRHRLQFWRLRTWIQSIIVTWQLIVTLDSIHNSCDVLNNLKVAPGRWDSVKNITHTYLYLWCPALIHYDHQRGKLMTKFKLSNRRNRYDIIMINAHWQFPQLGSI